MNINYVNNDLLIKMYDTLMEIPLLDHKFSLILESSTLTSETITNIKSHLNLTIKACNEILKIFKPVNYFIIVKTHGNISVKYWLIKDASLAKKISSLIVEKLNIVPGPTEISDNDDKKKLIYDQCEILNTLASRIFLLAKTYDEHKRECLLLVGVKDNNSLLSKIPSELITRLLDACIQYDLDQI